MKAAKIGLYGHFGAGNLGNECTLQAAIEQTLQCWPGAEVTCFCTNPQDVRIRHGIAALPSEAVTNTTTETPLPSQSRGGLARLMRIVFKRIPLELLHWSKSLREVRRTDVLIVAGTGIIADYMTGPLGWPDDIFKFSTLAALCRVKLAFLSVGVGLIHHPLSRWFFKKSLALASHRSYRDVASRQYLDKIGFNTGGDQVCPDLVFGLSPSNLFQGSQDAQRRVIGVGLKDYGTSEQLEPGAFRQYLDTMATFVGWLQNQGYSVRLLVGDFHYDSRVVAEFVEILKARNIDTSAPMLMAKPALTVADLLLQMSEAEVVISPRYHNLILALIQGKPIIALSDHVKLESLAVDFGLAQYHLSMRNLSADELISQFAELEADMERLRPYIASRMEECCHAIGAQCAKIATDRIRSGQAVEVIPE